MKTQNYYKALLAIATIQLAINLTPLLSSAAVGGVGDGGANSHNGQLLDSYIAENSQRLTFDEVLQQNPLVQKFIDQAASKLSGFKFYARSKKSWLFMNGSINAKDFPDCVNSSAVSVDKKIIACQWNDSFIIIDKKWFDSKSESTRAGLIMHEIYVGLAQDGLLYSRPETKRVTELEIQLFNGGIFKNDRYIFNKTTQQLYNFMQSLNASEVATPEFLTAINAFRRQFYNSVTKVCKLELNDYLSPETLTHYLNEIDSTPVSIKDDSELRKLALTSNDLKIWAEFEYELKTRKSRYKIAVRNIITVILDPREKEHIESRLKDLNRHCERNQYKEINLDKGKFDLNTHN